MSDTPTPGDKSPSNNSGCWRAFVFVVVAIIVAATVLALYFGESLKQFAGKFGQGFFSSEVTVAGSQILLEIGRTHGDVLEVASPLKTLESFRRADNRFAAWGWVYLGTTTSEIKVPAHYRFHIKLSELQDARLEEGVLSITAKTIYPTLPVAFNTAGMEKKSDDTWLRFDAIQQLAELEKSITPELAVRASGHISNIREAARKDIEEFVQKWIVDTHPEYKQQVRAVKVLFPGESTGTSPKLKPVQLP